MDGAGLKAFTQSEHEHEHEHKHEHEQAWTSVNKEKLLMVVHACSHLFTFALITGIDWWIKNYFE